jgi:hypothetical protein
MLCDLQFQKALFCCLATGDPERVSDLPKRNSSIARAAEEKALLAVQQIVKTANHCQAVQNISP